MNIKTPVSELTSRMLRFRSMMDLQHPEWQYAVIFSKINLLYFTGSMPEGMLVIERDGENTLFARRSYERTLDESLFENIKAMESYRDAAAGYNSLSGTVHLETEFVPLAMYQRFLKHFPFSEVQSLDFQMAMTRAVKSDWELSYMEASGKIHQKILEERVPALLREGMTEAELAGELYQVMIEEGHQGVARFNMFDTEIAVGQIAFGDNSLYPTNFNGPGGQLGLSPASPSLGSRQRRLKQGDLVFVDAAVGVNGYHTDKTMTYVFRKPLPQFAVDIHNQCVDIQNRVAEMLKPGNIPAEIYEKIMSELKPEFLNNFMGYGNRQVKFLGHGIGLTVDELPVIATGFNEPLVENIVFAVEPKKGIESIGMVGTENSFVVTSSGGRCLTGNHPGLILVE
ncbi:M24 family metallopeptidase [Alkalitalea saponilacus]|uniref:Xaa-Pro aminopeptidase n=1 Tax=Alkalitalea saponilacus TaxID=889453 RepID=A0A1T5E7Y4_9BACT|nr:Xaa-Pro peptidase family protein [Alkalitalea saponilacus]ASB49081.1 peptidase M24 [Alkalitalea saponilacus]SKB80107.1 Xaa-Pro aminopeptidase [Alkalitalea saponilacus]